MAKIVLGVGTAHSPMLSTPHELWRAMGEADKVNGVLVHPQTGEAISYEDLLAGRETPYKVDEALFEAQWRACQDAIEVLGTTIAEHAPDVLVVVSADQREMFFDDNMPSLMIYWGDTVPLLARQTAPNAPETVRSSNWGYGDVDIELPVESSLGAHLIHSLIEEGFDLSHARYVRPDHIYGGEIGPGGYIPEKYVIPPKRQGVGHGWTFIVKRLLDNKPIPLVPVIQNSTFPPNRPTPRRCLQTGKAIRRAIESWPSDQRVCVVASGGLSHFVTNEDLDRKVIAAIQAKDEATLAGLPARELESATGEIRNWVTVAAACDHLRAELVDYVPVYRSQAGSGGGWAFMRWL